MQATDINFSPRAPTVYTLTQEPLHCNSLPHHVACTRASPYLVVRIPLPTHLRRFLMLLCLLLPLPQLPLPRFPLPSCAFGLPLLHLHQPCRSFRRLGCIGARSHACLLGSCKRRCCRSCCSCDLVGVG